MTIHPVETLTPMQAAEAEVKYRNLKPLVARVMKLVIKRELLEHLTDDELLEIRDQCADADDLFYDVREYLEELQVVIERKLRGDPPLQEATAS